MKTKAHQHPRFDRKPPPSQSAGTFNLVACLNFLRGRNTDVLSIIQTSRHRAPVVAIPFGITAWTLGGEPVGRTHHDGRLLTRYEAKVHGCLVQWLCDARQATPFH